MTALAAANHTIVAAAQPLSQPAAGAAGQHLSVDCDSTRIGYAITVN